MLDDLTPEALYRQERARAQAKGKPVMKRVDEVAGPENGEMTEAQLEEAKKLYQEKYGDVNHSVRPRDD